MIVLLILNESIAYACIMLTCGPDLQKFEPSKLCANNN